MAYPNYPRSGKIRQGGESWLQLFLQKDKDTPVTAAQLASRPDHEKVSRQATRFGFLPDGERLVSEAIAGSIDRQASQPGQVWAQGPVESEVYMTHMTTYVQGLISADRATTSVAIADRSVLSSENVTPTGENFRASVSKESGADITITNHPSDPANNSDPNLPKQLEISIDAGSGNTIPKGYWVRIEGTRKTGLSPYDVEVISETLTQETAAQTLTKTANADDFYFDTITGLVFSSNIEVTNANIPLAVTITAKTGQKRTPFEETNDIFDGWTYLGSHGGEPVLGYGVTPVSGNLQISDTARLLMELVTGLGWTARTLVGGIHEERYNFDLDNADATQQDTTHPEHASGFPFIKNVFYPGRMGVLELDDYAVIFNDIDLVINNALTPLEGSSGSLSRLPLVRDTSDRIFDCNFTAYYEDPNAAPYTNETDAPEFIDWRKRFRTGALTKATVYVFYWNEKGKQTQHKITFAACSIGAMPRPTVDNKGRLAQSIALESIKSGTQRVIAWEIIDDNGWTNPTYA